MFEHTVVGLSCWKRPRETAATFRDKLYVSCLSICLLRCWLVIAIGMIVVAINMTMLQEWAMYTIPQAMAPCCLPWPGLVLL